MKKRIPAVILMFSLFLTGAFAANTYQKSINVEYGISLSINGQTPRLTDVNGKTVQPFVYDGTTYVPIRAVAENLGANISYDGNANKASLVSSNQSSGISEQDIQIISAIEDMEDISNAYISISNGYSTICSAILSDYPYDSSISSLNSIISDAQKAVQSLKSRLKTLSPYMVSGMYDDLSENIVLLEDCISTAEVCQNIVSHLRSNPYDFDAIEDLMDGYSLLSEVAMSVGTSAENAFNQWVQILANKA